MDSISTDFWDVLLWSFWFFIWISALMVWFRCLFDLFGDPDLSGWGKAGWSILLIFVPWLGALIYLIARGRSMANRQMAAVAQQQAAQQEYIQQVAGKSASPRPARSPMPRHCSTPAPSARPSLIPSRRRRWPDLTFDGAAPRSAVRS